MQALCFTMKAYESLFPDGVQVPRRSFLLTDASMVQKPEGAKLFKAAILALLQDPHERTEANQVWGASISCSMSL